MPNNKPLRFSALTRRIGDPHSALHWITLIFLLALLPLGFILFYSLSIRWFQSSFSNAYSELVQQEAFRASKTIVDNLTPTMARGNVSDEDRKLINRIISVFIRDNHNANIVGVIVSNNSGRIVGASILPQAATGPVLKGLAQPGRSLEGYDIESLLTALTAEQPNLQPVSNPVQILVPGKGLWVGSVIMLVDRTIPTRALDLAISRLTGRQSLLLVAVTACLVLAMLLMRRQQRLSRRLMERRSEIDRLAYVGTLAAGLAHEIRNPLNALAMQLELLEEDVGEGAPQLVAPRLQHIRKGLAGVERTVHDFLSYATPGRQQPQTIELNSILSPLCEEVAQTAPELQVRMECVVASGLSAWCDPHALRQILGNLISNALRAQKKKEGGGQLRIEASRNGQWIDILVEDAGPGVPSEQRGRIFDAFYTTQSEGTGLGLPIARRLAEMNGGQLVLDGDSTTMGGARFRLRLSSHPIPLPFD